MGFRGPKATTGHARLLVPLGQQAKGGVAIMAGVTDPKHHEKIGFYYKMGDCVQIYWVDWVLLNATMGGTNYNYCNIHDLTRAR